MKFFVTLALCASVLLAATASATETRSGSYAISATPVVSFSFHGTVAGNAINTGGVSFVATGGDWLSISVADASAGPVAFSVGQCTSGGTACTDDIGPFAFCGTSADLSSLGLDANLDLHVYVLANDGSCSGVATSGSVTVTNADPVA